MSERPAPFRRNDFTTYTVLQTRWSDNDTYGHMNNVVHYSLFDTVVNEWLIENGMLKLDGNSLIGLVVESGCSYFSELKFPDKIEAGIRLRKLGNSSVVYEIGLFRQGEAQAAAQGFFTHVYINAKSRKPTALPNHWRQKLEPLLHE